MNADRTSSILAWCVGVVCALALPACSSTNRHSSEALLRSPEFGTPWSSLSATDGILNCTATVDTGASSALGFDIEKRLDAVAIELQVRLKADQATVELRRAFFRPTLFLENGQALEELDWATIREELKPSVHDVVDKHRFKQDFLQKSSDSADAAAGLLFFRLPEGARRSGYRLETSGKHGEAYEVDLRRSMIAFTYGLEGAEGSSKRRFRRGIE